ncbi:MAG: CHAP domain-containing protein [Betaproteobacteria bacterium]|nr:CHAP domain-containing protein [Betaproteobacteria bacterium]
MKRKLLLILGVLILAAIVFIMIENTQVFSDHMIGDVIDNFNGVNVYYNGSVSNVSGRNVTADNYNLGQKYQCVEFVKRYYYEYYHHKMPDSYGHAKDFFNSNLKDGDFNEKRALTQYRNPSQSQPKVGDLLIFGGNRYGHVAIISEVKDDEIEIIQQNPGLFEKSRINIPVNFQNGLWSIEKSRILGWLRKNDEITTHAR